MAGNAPYDPVKFWALARYIQWEALDRTGYLWDPEQVLGAMFLIDFEAYRQLGASITGATWTRMPDGFTATLTLPA